MNISYTCVTCGSTIFRSNTSPLNLELRRRHGQHGLGHHLQDGGLAVAWGNLWKRGGKGQLPQQKTEILRGNTCPIDVGPVPSFHRSIVLLMWLYILGSNLEDKHQEIGEQLAMIPFTGRRKTKSPTEKNTSVTSLKDAKRR